ncbi:MAG: undecaprenyl-diphosphate phosphatase [Coraliomargaritaceae bacterium]
MRHFALFLSLLAISAEAKEDSHFESSALPVLSLEDEDSLNYVDALILGLVEGVTEYLPVSSTGHLILTNAALGLNGDAPVQNRSGEVILVTDKNDQLRPYTIGEATFAYIIVIQAGAIAAVLLLYRASILEIIKGCLGASEKGRKLAVNLFVAFLPAASLGLLLNDWIEELLGENILAVAAALIVGAFVMLFVERRRKRLQKADQPHSRLATLEELTPKHALLIGCFQCTALLPGTSRSMATIVGGYIAGLSPKYAAEFSFLLGLITLGAASGYTLLKDGSEMLQALAVGPVLVGCLVAFISAALAVKWLVGYLNRHGLEIFAWYRILLAILILLLSR